MSVVEPRPNPETVAVLLDTTWRLAGAEAARTDAIDRKAATVASFASLVAALTATLGLRFVEEVDAWWAIGLFVVGLAALLGSVATAIRALWPREYVTIGVAYMRRFPTWGEILKTPEQVRGETMRTLVEAVTQERAVSDGKLTWLRLSFPLLLLGLVLIAAEGATLAIEEVRGRATPTNTLRLTNRPPLPTRRRTTRRSRLSRSTSSDGAAISQEPMTMATDEREGVVPAGLDPGASPFEPQPIEGLPLTRPERALIQETIEQWKREEAASNPD